MDLSPYYPLLRATSLLRHMRDDELDHLLHCFNPRVRRYQKGELLLLAGYETREVGILLEGQIIALKTHRTAAAWRSPRWKPAACLGMCFRAQAKKARSA